MSKKVAVFNLLKSGDWKGHLELRDLGGTDFRARISDIRKELDGTAYEIETRPSTTAKGTNDYRLRRTETPDAMATHLANVEADIQTLQQYVTKPSEEERPVVSQERARAAAEATRKQLQEQGII